MKSYIILILRKKNGIVLKLDFEKAYDKVNWDFLLECHKLRGFDDKWCKWIEQILHNGIVSVKINNIVGAYFQSHKGVRQGDPLSPFLFNLAAECLTNMVMNAQKNNLFKGLASDLIPNGVPILQYADDTVLCIEDDIDKAVNLKLLLYMFELMSGLKINFLKSEVLCVGGDDSVLQKYAELFGCQIGHLPMKYLGVPVSYSSLRNVDWEFVAIRYLKRCDAWIGSSASSGG